MNTNTISPDLLHKGSADDVLICRPRAALPLYLEEAVAASCAPGPVLANYVACDTAGRKLPLPQERKSPVGNSPLNPAGADASWNTVRALPYQIAAPYLLEKNGAAGQDGSRLNHELEKFCESVSAVRRSSSFEFINDADNYFFYRKAHEHVPGTMFIEAARQAVYHHLYRYTRHERGAVTVSLNQLTANFYAYAELMYPIELVVDDLSQGDPSLPKNLYYRVAFYQRQNVFAIVDTKATVIDIPLFEKTRNIFIFSDDWFAPISQSKLTCTITAADGRSSGVTLLGLGKNGCITTSPEIATHSAKSMHIRYDGKLGFSTSVKVRQQGQHSSWDFLDLSFGDLQTISDIVKRGFIHLDTAARSALEG